MCLCVYVSMVGRAYGWLLLLVSYGLFAAVHRAHWEVEHYLSEHTSEFEEEMAEQGEVLPQLDGRGSSSSSATSGGKKRSKEGSMVEMVRRRREAIRRRSARSEDGDEEAREGGERLMLRVQQAAEKKEARAGRNAFRRCVGHFLNELAGLRPLGTIGQLVCGGLVGSWAYVSGGAPVVCHLF